MTTVFLTVTSDRYDLFNKVGTLRSFEYAQDDIPCDPLPQFGMTVLKTRKYKSVWDVPKRSYSFLCVFDLLYQSCKSGGIVDSDLRQDLAVERDLCLLKAVHEC